MSIKSTQIFDSFINGRDTLDKAFSAVGNLTSEEITASVADLINASEKSLECVVTLLVKNTDLATNTLNKDILTHIDCDQAKKQLQKIAIISRRIERELSANGESS